MSAEQRFDIIDVVQVVPQGGYRLAITFSDGTKGEQDFGALVAAGGDMVEPLRDQTFFGRVFLDDGILTWPNGFDLDSIALHMEMKDRGLLRRGVLRQRHVERVEQERDHRVVPAQRDQLDHPGVAEEGVRGIVGLLVQAAGAAELAG